MASRKHHVYLGSLKVDQSCVGVRGDPVAQMQPNHIKKKKKKKKITDILSVLPTLSEPAALP